MSLNKWCMWPMDDVGNVCMASVVARSERHPGLLLCGKHARQHGEPVDEVCACTCVCLNSTDGGSTDKCWPCWSDILDHGALVHLDKIEHIRAVKSDA